VVNELVVLLTGNREEGSLFAATTLSPMSFQHFEAFEWLRTVNLLAKETTA